MREPTALAWFTNALAFWLVLLLALLTTAVSTGPQGCTKDKAYVTAAKSDLRNMLTLQETYREQHGRYASAMELQSVGLEFRNSTGVELTIEHADAQAFRARAIHVRLPKTTCGIDSKSGEPMCFDAKPRWQPPRFMANTAFNVAVDLWLFAITLARRQRRLSAAMASRP